jgi:hypothetical protein
VARVIYSRPQKADRTVFGDLVEYGKVWRLGANEAYGSGILQRG